MMNKFKQRKQLPLPEESSPLPSHKNRELPPVPSDNDQTAPPPVPSRPGGGVHRPPPPPPAGQKVPARNPLENNRHHHSDADSDAETDSSYEAMDNPPDTPPRGYRSVTSDDEPGEVYADVEDGDSFDDDEDSGQENYDDFDTEDGQFPDPPQEEYDDFNEQREQEEYDEFEVEQPTYEMEPPPIQEDTYEAVPEANVSQAPRVPPSRPPPSVPSSVPGPPPAPPHAEFSPGEETYEEVPQSYPSPPPARKKELKPPIRTPPKAQEQESAPVHKAVMGGGALGIDLSAIQNKRGNLKKVNRPVERENSDPHEVKEYGETTELKSPFDIFKAKDKASGGAFPVLKKSPSSDSGGKPSITSPKPSPITTKPTSVSHAINKALPRPKSSPPPPPVDRDRDRPPLPGGHPVAPPINRLPPAPPTKNLPPTPPVKRDNYSQVNKPRTDSPTVVNGGGAQEEEDIEEGEIYDDAFSNNDPMMKYEWYFGEIERDVGNKALKTKSENGVYLLRKSTRGGDNQPYTLMVMYNGHIYNLKVRTRPDGRYALGEEKSDEISFKAVDDLILHHQKNDVILVHKSGQRYETVLKTIPERL